MKQKLTSMLLVLALALLPSACGKKSNPTAPDGSNYPHIYPTR